MRVLITGSSGQIGTNLALSLQRDGYQVRGVDRRENTWTAEVDTVLHDLNIPLPATLLSEVDVVVHLAAYAKVHELVEHPERSLENVATCFNVLEACRLQRLPVIFSSSREVYGNIPLPRMFEEAADFSVAASPYSASKIAGEAFVYSYARCYEIPYIVFRFSNVYGRFDNDLERMERVIPLFVRKISRGEPITIFGADKTLDFTYVDDCVAGIRAAIDRLWAGTVRNETINLAYGSGRTLGDLARMIGDALGAEPQITIDSAYPGEVTRYIADVSKARLLLDWQPQTPLEVGVPLAVREALAQWSKQPERIA